jgi:hypothetical protein
MRLYCIVRYNGIPGQCSFAAWIRLSWAKTLAQSKRRDALASVEAEPPLAPAKARGTVRTLAVSVMSE